jgi:hypothetical protein
MDVVKFVSVVHQPDESQALSKYGNKIDKVGVLLLHPNTICCSMVSLFLFCPVPLCLFQVFQ